MKILFFFNSWNPRCKRVRDNLDILKSKYSNLEIQKIDMDQDIELTKQYSIKGSPSVLFIKEDNIVGKVIGGGPISFYTEILDKYE